jgi:chitinase
VCWQVDCKKGNPDEKQNFVKLVKQLSDAFLPRGLLLSSAVSPSKTVIDAAYDVAALSEWIAVMCYDYHGQWDKKTGHVAPLYHHPEDDVDFFNTVRPKILCLFENLSFLNLSGIHNSLLD